MQCFSAHFVFSTLRYMQTNYTSGSLFICGIYSINLIRCVLFILIEYLSKSWQINLVKPARMNPAAVDQSILQRTNTCIWRIVSKQLLTRVISK